MKQYGEKSATEFTKKQIGVIYSLAKKGELKIEKWFIKELYNLADFYGIDWNKGIAAQESDIKKILEDVFANDYTAAQDRIDSTTEEWFNLLSIKNQKNCDREIM